MKKLFMLEPAPGSQIPKYVTATNAEGGSLFASGALQKLPEQAYLTIPQGVPQKDRLLTVGNEMVLSAAATSVLASCKVDPAVSNCALQLTPAAVASKWGGYFLWHAGSRHEDVLHESALVREIRGNILSVFEWVLSADRIPPYDLWLGPTNRWRVTERLVDAVFEKSLTGFGFAAIPCC